MLDGRISNAPHVPRARAFRDSRDMLRNPVAVFERYRTELGPTFTFHFGGVKPTMATSDPVVVEHVLKGHRDNYVKSAIQVDHMVEFQGKGLVNSHGEAWLRQRKLLAQGFRPSHLAKLLPMQQEVLDELMRAFDRDASQGSVDVHHQMARFTLRLVGRSLLGRRIGDQELDQIGETITKIQSFIFGQVIRPYTIPWTWVSGQHAKYQKLRRDGDEIVLRHIRARLDHGGADGDLLRVLMETPYHDTGEPMSHEAVLIESIQLLVAGNETSSSALTWILYLLARHPQCVAEMRDEIAAVIGDSPIDYRNLHQLAGTMRVVDEALRLFPPFWTIDRVALADDDVAGVHIPAGTMVMPYIYGTHRNPAHWENTEAFDPRRFESDRSHGRHPFAYIPFGGGPRICIGNNMAIMQILMIVVTFVRTYDFQLTQNCTVGIRPMMLLKPDGAVAMTFRRVS